MLERDLFAFLEKTADAAFSITERGEIRSWNKAAEKLFGYPACEAINRTCHELLDGHGTLGMPVFAGEHVQACVADTAEISDFDLQVRTRSGERRWVNVSTLLFDEVRTGRRLIVHLARDISQQKQTEDLIEKMTEISRQILATSGRADGAAPVAPLSDQEKRILRLFVNAKNSAEIARELGITLPTLRNHLHSINVKLGTHNRLEAVTHALRRGLI
jgi:PAS domain S-box-containing protein